MPSLPKGRQLPSNGLSYGINLTGSVCESAMNEIELYVSIRSEIVTNHVLMHLLTFMVIVVLLVGVWVAEQRTTILSVFLPLVAIAWAAAIVRFDFFIHRQGEYLRRLEATLIDRGTAVPLWESWKAALYSPKLVVPIADILVIVSIVVPTTYLLFGPARNLFRERGLKSHPLFAWSVIGILALLLLILPFVPMIASR